jgi:2-polyprenyl-3-methyl-5-hydroxy-6-metoxy-1,4-benzoquinol methylase
MDLQPHMVVADLACGNGLLLELIHERVAHYHGVDFSSEFIEEARRERARIRNGEFHCQSIEDFCEEHPGQIDRAFALDFAEHVYDDQLLGVARSIRSCLREDGRLYVHTPNLDFVLEQLKAGALLRQFPEHVAVRDERSNVEIFRQAGFARVEVAHLPHYLPALAWLHVCSRVPGLGRFLRARLFLECSI